MPPRRRKRQRNTSSSSTNIISINSSNNRHVTLSDLLVPSITQTNIEMKFGDDTSGNIRIGDLSLPVKPKRTLRITIKWDDDEDEQVKQLDKCSIILDGISAESVHVSNSLVTTITDCDIKQTEVNNGDAKIQGDFYGNINCKNGSVRIEGRHFGEQVTTKFF